MNFGKIVLLSPYMLRFRQTTGLRMTLKGHLWSSKNDREHMYYFVFAGQCSAANICDNV